MNIIRKKDKNPLAKAFARPLSDDAEIEYRKLTVVEELLQYMKRSGVKRTELAKRMGVVPSRITKMLDGTENLTIDTLVRAGLAVGAELHQTYTPKGHKVRWLTYMSSKSETETMDIKFPSIKEFEQIPTPAVTGGTIAEKDDEYAA